MAPTPPPVLVDGFVSLLRGMNAGVDETLLDKESYAFGSNLTSRRGLITTRPAFTKALDLLDKTVFQGAGRWSLDGGDMLVIVADGNLVVVNCDTGATTSVSVSMDPLATCRLTQVDEWMLIQDGTSRPVVLEKVGAAITAYRNPTDTIPVCLVPGYAMCYAHGRIHYVPAQVPDLANDDGDFTGIPAIIPLNGRMMFVSSDRRLASDPSAVFSMEEHMNLQTGGGFNLPLEAGYITALEPLRNAATGTGVGALIAFGREGVAAFDVSIPRDQWSSVAISQMLFTGAGTRSPWSVCSVNGDLVFVDTEGHVRTLRYTGSAASNSLVNTPLSNELTPYVSTNSIERVSGTYFDRRYVATFRGSDDVFGALAALDFAPVYGLGAQPSAMYDGFYTGFQFLQVLSARRNLGLTLFAVVRNDSGGLSVMYWDETGTLDNTVTPIQSILVTRKMTFDNLGDVKILQYVEIDVSDLKHSITMEVFARPDTYPYWTSLGTKTINVPQPLPSQYRRRLRFAVDFDSTECQDTNNEKLYVGLKFQFLIRVTGHYRLERFRTVADAVREAPPECEPDNEADAVPTAGQDIDYFAYEVPV